MTALTAPEGLIAIAGELVPRRRGFAHRSEPVKCLKDHTIEARGYLLDGWSTPHCPECDMAMVIVSSYNGFQFRADLTAEEATEISARGWRLGEVLRYTGAAIGERVG
jgi:hypothetical protein